MRHGKKFNHLSRKAPHRSAMLSNMASQLIMYKRIKTTVAKAKALRKYIEPLITKSKNDTTHTRRIVYSHLGHKDPVKELFITVADRVGERPGGYTRIIKLGKRLGDNAEMAYIELVDFNELLLKEKKEGKKRRKRTRRSGSGKSSSSSSQSTKTEESKTEDTPKTEESLKESSNEGAKEAKAEAPATEKTEVKEKPKAEESKKSDESNKVEAEKKNEASKAEKEDTDDDNGEKEK